MRLLFEESGAFALHSSPRAFSVLVGNLIRNACQYTEEGSVTVSVETDRVVVRDTGVGMSEEERRARSSRSFAASRVAATAMASA